MKKVIYLLLATSFVCLSGINYAQIGTNKMAATEEPTPANTLKWTKEVLPKMELLSIKLGEAKPTNPKDIESQKIFLKALQTLRNINAKGTKLTAAEASQHNRWFNGIVNRFYIDCQAISGNVCCMDCQNHGILGVWCFANCFVVRFPGID